jgi:lysozyme family protein
MTRDDIIAFVLKEEGGLVDDPADPGGRTNFGITQKYLAAAQLSHTDMNLPATVDELTSEQAAELYRRDEWFTIHGDALPAPLALLVMDCAVNSGPKRAIEMLQEALDGVSVDGVMGPHTLSAAGASPGIVDEYAARHAAFYAGLEVREGKFELGWMRRLMRAHRLAAGNG